MIKRGKGHQLDGKYGKQYHQKEHRISAHWQAKDLLQTTSRERIIYICTE